jgi:phosphodiesterase/alkaline phosphatase D-like protein
MSIRTAAGARRDVLALSLFVGSCSWAVGGASLPNGVAAGDTTSNSAVLWTRSTTIGDVLFEYSTDATFGSGVSSVMRSVVDGSVPVKADIGGLAAGTRYYYRATDANGETVSGTLKTSAAAGQRTGLRFGVSGDWRGELAPYPAIGNAPGRNLDFFVGLGDTIYADFPSPAVPIPQAMTLPEFRAKHAEVYGERFGVNSFAALRASTSWFATIDDHEVTNDFAGGAAPSSDPRFAGMGGNFINETTLFQNGLQAFQEYNPMREEVYSGTGEARFDGKPKLYRERTFGQDAAMFVLDARSFRDEALENVTNPLDPAQVGQFLAASFDPTRTMLGTPQINDLKQGLLDAQSNGVTWKFVHVPEPIQNLGVVNAADRFEGYAAERTEILRFINENNIENVVFIAADIHGTIVNNLTYQESPGGAQIATGAFEITTGSVAFDAPFAPTVISLAAGVIPGVPPLELYESLPLEQREGLIQALINAQLAQLGYDPVGLDNNLPGADLIDAELLVGGWTATNSYGWTEFEIDAATQDLLVTTYGIDYYSEAELLADPDAILALTPEVLSQFRVRAVPTPGAVAIMTGVLAIAGARRRR